MAGPLDFLRNSQIFAQRPGVPSQNSDQMLSFGLGLLSGNTPQEQIGKAASNLTNERRLNKTVEWFKKNDPEMAQAIAEGLVNPSDAFKITYQRRLEAQAPKKPLEVNGRLVDPETYQVLADFSDGPKPNGITQDIGARQQAASSLGLTPDSPAYQSYILTGKMPREDQAPLTATDKKAILEADEMVLATRGAVPLIDRAIELNDKAYDGVGAGIRGTIAGNLGIEGGQNTMELDNVVTSQALGQLKAIFGAAPTEGERKILLDIQGSVNQPAAVRREIFKRAKVAAERRLQFYEQRATEMRGGEFYKPNGGATRGARQTSSGVTWSVD